MTPTKLQARESCSRFLNAKFGTQPGIRNIPASIFFAHKNNIIGSEFCHTIGFSHEMHRTTLFRFVLSIIAMCSEKKMRGVYATRIITPVKNAKLIRRVFFMLNSPRDSVSTAMNSSMANKAISIEVFRAEPNPAFFLLPFFDFCPKATQLVISKFDGIATICDYARSFFHSSFMIEVRARMAGYTVAALAYYKQRTSALQLLGGSIYVIR